MQIALGDLVFDARAQGPEDGPLVLLLHGFPQTSFSWRHQIPALAEAGYHVVAPDQRGYSPGARPAAVDQYELRHLVGDVLGWADHLGADRFHVVGHDWGGAVAWQVAITHPDRLLSATAVSTPHPAAFRQAFEGGEQREKSSYMEFFRSDGAEDGFLDNDAALLRGIYASIGPEGEEYVTTFSNRPTLTAALNWYRANHGIGAESGDVTVPTLYVWSTNDMALGADAAHATAEHVTGPYRFEVLHGVSHWIPEEAPDELTRLILEHLNSVA